MVLKNLNVRVRHCTADLALHFPRNTRASQLNIQSFFRNSSRQHAVTFCSFTLPVLCSESFASSNWLSYLSGSHYGSPCDHGSSTL
jgi:hypothetical protein